MEDFVSRSKVAHSEYNPKQIWWGAFDPEHRDTRRHFHMLATTDPLIEALGARSVLTLGDKFGRDAHYFKRFHGLHVAASELDAAHLAPLVEADIVDEVHSIDVEAIPLADGQFDVVLVKEAYHHFPRPMLGLYEMLRVAARAVVMLEPVDVREQGEEPLYAPDLYHDAYEEVGNFKHGISLRELAKAAWALSLPAIAARGWNDPYDRERSFEEYLEQKERLDELGHDGKRPFNLATVALLKDPTRLGALEAAEGYTVHRCPPVSTP